MLCYVHLKILRVIIARILVKGFKGDNCKAFCKLAIYCFFNCYVYVKHIRMIILGQLISSKTKITIEG